MLVLGMVREDGRERFFRAALEVCAEKGYHEMRIDEVVKRAGGSKGGLYHHFEGKRALFLQLFERIVGDIQQKLAALLDPALPAAESLRRTFETFAEIARDTALIRSLVQFYVVGLHDEVVRESFRRFYREALVPRFR